MFDVIVVGAGPAGCAAANRLARGGAKVLLVEKFKLPRYKSCSGQIIKKSRDLVKSCFGEDVPSAVTCAPAENRGTVLFGANGRVSRFEQEALNVWRSGFDFWLANKAVAAGAELRDETMALSCAESGGDADSDSACGGGAGEFVEVALKRKGGAPYAERAKYIVVAEGVAGNLARKIAQRRTPTVTTFQTFNRGEVALDPHFFHAFLQPEFSEYDAWLNVKDGQIVIGVAAFSAEKIAGFYARFADYLKAEHALEIDAQLRAEKWLLPRVYPECRIDHGRARIFFAGEAAGFLNPMGEGISCGLESGDLAAQAILHNFGSADSARAAYAASTAQLQAYMQRQWALAARLR